MTSPNKPRAHVVGLGLIGASICRALRRVGWDVSGSDLSAENLRSALDQGVVDGESPRGSQLVVLSTPAGTIVELAHEWLSRNPDPELIVTDVAGVKASIVEAIDDPRFIGGHPMAGSELRGLAGARDDLFNGCTWVLTPTAVTTPEVYGRLHGILRDIGANVVAVSPRDHDRLVAIASHVPHLLAGALMNEASRVAEQDAVLLQLAAGGFRDMTRIAAGDPTIWPDVLFENRDAVVNSLAALESRIHDLRAVIDARDIDQLTSLLDDAARARRHLPGRALSAEKMTHLRISISDQPGSLARVTTAASDMLVNIYDIEIAHGIEGTSGTLLLAVDSGQSGLFASTLRDLGFVVGFE